MRLKDKDIERFWGLVSKTGGCWLWMLPPNSRGYGKFAASGDTHAAHRVSYFLSNGALPKGAFVCHSCDNPICVNPDHLFVGSHKDNMADMATKGRAAKFHAGSDGWSRAKLTDDEIREILSVDAPNRLLAKLYDISSGAVRYVKRRGRGES